MSWVQSTVLQKPNQNYQFRLDVVGDTCYPSTKEAGACGSQVQGQPVLHHKTLNLKKKNVTNTTDLIKYLRNYSLQKNQLRGN